MRTKLLLTFFCLLPCFLNSVSPSASVLCCTVSCTPPHPVSVWRSYDISLDSNTCAPKTITFGSWYLMILDGWCKLIKVPTKMNTADMATKILPATQVSIFSKIVLGLQDTLLYFSASDYWSAILTLPSDNLGVMSDTVYDIITVPYI